MNPDRWNHMANAYKKVGLVPMEATIEGFLYDPNRSRLEDYSWQLKLLFWAVIGFGAAALFLFLFNRRLGRLVKMQTADHRNQEARVRAILDNAAVGIVTMTESGIVESLNQTACEIFGYTIEEVVGNNINMLMPEPDHSRHDHYLKHYRKTGEKKIIGFGREVMAKRKNGEIFHMDLSVSEVYIGGRRIFNGIVQDITKRKEAESALVEIRNQLKLAIKGSNLGLWDINLISREATYDERWANMLGYKLKEIEQTGEFFESLLHPDDLQNVYDNWRQHEEGKSPFYSLEFRLRTKDGGWKWILTHGQFVEFDKDGTPIRGVGIHQDITERKEVESKLAKTRNHLEMALTRIFRKKSIVDMLNC